MLANCQRLLWLNMIFLAMLPAGVSVACEKNKLSFFKTNLCDTKYTNLSGLYGHRIINATAKKAALRNVQKPPNARRQFPISIEAYSTSESSNKMLSKDGREGKAVMTIRCIKNNTSVLFEFPGYEMSDHKKYSEILYNTGNDTNYILELSLAENTSIMGVWRGFRAVPFVRKLIGKQNLDIIATAKNGADLSANFDISNLSSEISNVRKSCQW